MNGAVEDDLVKAIMGTGVIQLLPTSFSPFTHLIEMFDLSILKVALEYAQFQDFRIRDKINDVLKNVEADMDEVGFDGSHATKKHIAEFETLITDIETARSPKQARFEIREDNEPVKEINRIPDDEELDIHKVKNVDDELEEYIETITVKPKK